MHFTPGLMARISSSSAKSSSTVLSGLVITIPNDRTRSRYRASACPAEYPIGKSAAESAPPISRLTWASLPMTRTRLMFYSQAMNHRDMDVRRRSVDLELAINCPRTSQPASDLLVISGCYRHLRLAYR